jgi:hypothetical protein
VLRRKKRLGLGEYPSVTLADARAKAHVARGTVNGERRDPEIVNEPSRPAEDVSEDVTGPAT